MARGAGAVVHEISACGVRSRPHAKSRRALARGRHASSSRHRTPSRRTTAGSRLSRPRRAPRPTWRARTVGNYPIPDARPPERFFLAFLYGSVPRVQTAVGEDEELTFEATLFSNVNAAIPRAVLDRFPFRDDVTMSEDQEWSRRVLRAGYALVYEPGAVVNHSHTYTVRTAFRRFFDSGVSAEHSYVEGDESRAALRRAGSDTRGRSSPGSGGRADPVDPLHRRLRAREVRRAPARAAARPLAAPARFAAQRAPATRVDAARDRRACRVSLSAPAAAERR